MLQALWLTGLVRDWQCGRSAWQQHQGQALSTSCCANMESRWVGAADSKVSFLRPIICAGVAKTGICRVCTANCAGWGHVMLALTSTKGVLALRLVIVLLLLLQERLANALASEVGVTNKQLSHLKKSEREHLLTALTAWQLPVQVCRLASGGGWVGSEETFRRPGTLVAWLPASLCCSCL